MSRYIEEIDQLTEWFSKRLAYMPAFSMTEEDYLAGTDCLSVSHKILVKKAIKHWGKHRRYELSYNQLNRAFFAAAFELGKITLIPWHPVFHLGSEVTVNEVTTTSGKTFTDVPGKITSVSGDVHIVTLEVAAIEGDKKPGSSCVRIRTDDLNESLVSRNS